MNRPPFPHMMNNMYRNPRSYNKQWRPRGHGPRRGFHGRSNKHFRPSTDTTNYEHWCETCDRGFATADLLDRHKQQHQKCNIDGCQYVAHPKVITRHIQMQHSSGLYKKIAKLDNPEEIQKWREERKKKYPTRINIEKKAAECKEKIERGEKMALKQDKNENNKSKDQLTGAKRRHNFENRNTNFKNNRPYNNQKPNQNYISNNWDQQRPKKIPKIIPKVPSVDEKNKLKPFSGILYILMEEDKVDDTMCETLHSTNDLIEDDAYEEPLVNLKEKPTQDPVLCGALTSLMCDYGSSDEDTNENESVLSQSSEATKPVAIENIQKVVEIDEKELSNVNNDNVRQIDEKELPNVNNVNVKDLQTVAHDIIKPEVTQTSEIKQSHDENSDNDSGPEEVINVKSNFEEVSPPEKQIVNKKEPSIHVKKNVPSKNNKRLNKYKPRVPSTLLQKLLHKEIRHERNIVLQCIRHIKKMNYFD